MIYTVVGRPANTLLRQRYTDRFIDTTLDHYEEHIATLRQCEDGLCYAGYLWVFIKGNEKYQYERTMEQALSYLLEKSQVYVMWDLFSKERIRLKKVLTDNYPKDTVIAMAVDELCRTITSEWDVWDDTTRYLPEDIYIFDDSMQWTVIFTHEGWDRWTKPELNEDDYVRICFVIPS